MEALSCMSLLVASFWPTNKNASGSKGRIRKKELANSKGSFSHRLRVVECNIDQLASTLKNIEKRFSNVNEQVPASNRAGSMHKRSKKNANSNTMTLSEETFQSSGAAHQPEVAPLVCNYSAFSKESARVNENAAHRALEGITDRQYQEDANARVEHEHSQMQLMLAKATRCLEQVVPLKQRHLSQKCSTVVGESDTAAHMPTN